MRSTVRLFISSTAVILTLFVLELHDHGPNAPLAQGPDDVDSNGGNAVEEEHDAGGTGDGIPDTRASVERTLRQDVGTSPLSPLAYDLSDVPTGYPFNPHEPIPGISIHASDLESKEVAAKEFLKRRTVNPTDRDLSTEEIGRLWDSIRREREELVDASTAYRDISREARSATAKAARESKAPRPEFSSYDEAMAGAKRLVGVEGGLARLGSVRTLPGKNKFTFIIVDPKQHLETYLAYHHYGEVSRLLEMKIQRFILMLDSGLGR